MSLIRLIAASTLAPQVMPDGKKALGVHGCFPVVMVQLALEMQCFITQYTPLGYIKTYGCEISREIFDLMTTDPQGTQGVHRWRDKPQNPWGVYPRSEGRVRRD